jgi:hypothetical protein
VNLRCARLRKADRPKVDPFSMHDADTHCRHPSRLGRGTRQLR